MTSGPADLDADILAYLAHDLDATRQDDLDRRLCADAAAAARFAHLCRHEIVLATVLRGTSGTRRVRPRRLAAPPMGRWWWAAAAVLMVAVGCGLAFRWGRHASPPLLATVTQSSGRSSVHGDGALGEVAVGTPLPAGAQLVIGADARLAFAYADGSRIALEPGSRLTLAAGLGKQVEVERGGLQASVTPQPEGRPLRLVTPQGEAVVVGTRFAMAVDAQTTRLTVSEGTVRLGRAADGASCLVKAGFACAVSAAVTPLVLQWAEPLAARLPAGARITRPSDLSAWEGEWSSPAGFPGLSALGSHAPRPGTRFMGEIRSPVWSDGPPAGADRYLAVRYLATGFRLGDRLKFMLKDARGVIYHGVIQPTTDAWSDAIVRLDGAFLDLGRSATPMPDGMPISQIVLLPIAPDGQEGISGPRLWLAEVICFSAPGAVTVQPVGRP